MVYGSGSYCNFFPTFENKINVIEHNSSADHESQVNDLLAIDELSRTIFHPAICTKVVDHRLCLEKQNI
jgi:hypothetical protein